MLSLDFSPDGRLIASGGAGALKGRLDLNGAVRTINVANGGAAIDADLAGAISGIGGGLTKTGSWTLVLSGANIYSGLTVVRGGRLAVAGTDALSGSTLSNIVAGSVTFVPVVNPLAYAQGTRSGERNANCLGTNSPITIVT